METLVAYKQQATRRVMWLLIAVALGAVAAFVVEVLDVGYPSWRAGVLVAGLVFFPWFLGQTFRRDQVSTAEAVKAFKEMHKGAR
ncbi:MAG: hypothetical protein GY847_28400 [Proteobacteria bacterium]|nr:hypothetical protein [Pseudomonadota bacterium]